MNLSRCITLHNEILLHGWTNSDHDADTFESRCKTWYDSAPEEAEEIRGGLTPDLFEFMVQARQPGEPFFAFFYFVQDLYQPACLFIDYERWQYDVEEGEEKRYVTLYRANQLGSHPMGLVFDQKTNLAILLLSLWDMEDHFTDKTFWRPLDCILESWLTMIRKGIVVAKSERFYNTHQTLQQSNQFPWMLSPHSEAVLDDTIDTFNRLIQTIEERLPQPDATCEKGPPVGLVEEETLDEMNLPPGFIYSFLTRVRCPRFKYIAPGLSIPTASIVMAQPFWHYLAYHKPPDTLPPFLLFASTHVYKSPQERTIRPPAPPAEEATSLWALLKTGWQIYSHASSLHAVLRRGSNDYDAVAEPVQQYHESPFMYPYNKTWLYNAGLYLSPDSATGEDRITLLIPEHVKGEGNAKISDGNKAKIDRDLYQTGFTAFKGYARPSLINVLRHWTAMVESGHWKIDEDGVVGGIELWAEADAEDTHQAYVLEMPQY